MSPIPCPRCKGDLTYLSTCQHWERDGVGANGHRETFVRMACPKCFVFVDLTRCEPPKAAVGGSVTFGPLIDSEVTLGTFMQATSPAEDDGA